MLNLNFIILIHNTTKVFTVPNILRILVRDKKSIPFPGILVQISQTQKKANSFD